MFHPVFSMLLANHRQAHRQIDLLEKSTWRLFRPLVSLISHDQHIPHGHPIDSRSNRGTVMPFVTSSDALSLCSYSRVLLFLVVRPGATSN